MTDHLESDRRYKATADKTTMARFVKYCDVTLAAMMLADGAEAKITDNLVRIGVMNDRSGPYVDIAGPGSVVAVQMAANEFADKLGDAKIEVVSADHQNKPDIGSSIVRRWFDDQGVDAVADVPTCSVAIAGARSRQAKSTCVFDLRGSK